MKKSEIIVGKTYLAKVSGVVTTVRVDKIREVPRYVSGHRSASTQTVYDVTNLRTGRKTTFRSAAKFRSPAPSPKPKTPGLSVGPLGGLTTDTPTQDGMWCRGKHYFHEGATRPFTCPKCYEESMNDSTKKGTLLPPSMTTTPPPVESYTLDEDGNEVQEDEQRRPFGSALNSSHVEPQAVSEPTARAASVCCAVTDVSGTPSEPREGEQSRPPTNVTSAKTEGAIASHTVESTGRYVNATTSYAPSVCSPTVPASTGASIASRIASVRTTRATGTSVAGMVPNNEQESILDTAVLPGLKVLVVAAGAGTGKTATLKMLEQVLPGRGQYTAFNSSLVTESKAKFTKAACNTTHSLAFRAIGRLYAHRLNSDRMRSTQIAHILGIQNMQVQVPGQVDSDGNPKPKNLSAGFLAGQVLVAIRQFCQSADSEVTLKHLRYIDGIDGMMPSGRRGTENNDRVHQYLLPFVRQAWADIARTDGILPFSHDHYVKLWQLGTGNDRPVIAADYILLDEAQDTAPVFLDIIKRQEHALVVLVGDSNQSIYEWRGAVDAMKAYADAPRRLLSQSYRFGQAVADVANTILATLEEPTDLVMRGMPTIPSRVDKVTEPRCYLYRTNAGALARVMLAIASGKRPHLIGGGDETVKWCQAAIDLQAKKPTQHPELSCFDTWEEVVEYSKTDEGGDLRLMVKLVKEFGAAAIRDTIKNMPKEAEADLVVSTAHKSKGREWGTVRLGPDFPLANAMTDADRRLLYVAVTRAKLTLDISECPPFCGGYEKGGEDGDGARWIPGLQIQYTSTMPSQEEQDAYVKGVSTAAAVVAGYQAVVAPPAVVAKPAAVNPDPRYRFGVLNSKWYVVGPAIEGVERNHTLRVPKRDGSAPAVYIQSVVKKEATQWWYDVTATATK